MERLARLVNSEHKVVAGPRTLLVFAVVFGVLLTLVHFGAGQTAEPFRDQLVRATVGSVLIMGVLVWSERARPHGADLRA